MKLDKPGKLDLAYKIVYSILVFLTITPLDKVLSTRSASIACANNLIVLIILDIIYEGWKYGGRKHREEHEQSTDTGNQ